MGKKISELTPGTTLAGNELVAVVQNGSTVNAPASSFSTFPAVSGNFALRDVNNNFSTGQTIQGPLTAQSFSLSATGFSWKKNDSFSLTITDHETIDSLAVTILGGNAGLNMENSDFSVCLGYDAGNSIGASSGSAENSISIGYDAGSSGGSYSGSADGIIAIGTSAGLYAGSDTGDSDYTIYIGADVGQYSGYSASGSSSYSVMIGYGTGQQSGNLNGSVTRSNMIGYNAGYHAGAAAGSARNSNLIGNSAGSYAGYNGSAIALNSMGSYAGYFAGYEGDADNSNVIGSYAGENMGNQGSANNVNAMGNRAALYAGGLGGSANNIIAIGTSAGKNAGYGNGNIVDESIYIGLSAGEGQRARKNIFIGSNTNTTSPSVTSLSGCIAIGYGAKPSAPNTIALGSVDVPLSAVPGITLTDSVSGLKIMVNGTYFTIPLLA